MFMYKNTVLILFGPQIFDIKMSVQAPIALLSNLTVGVVAKRSTVALSIAGSIPARNKFSYLSELHLVVPGLAVREYEFKCL